MLRHRDRHNRRPADPIRLDWHELISQANDSILRTVIRRAPELADQVRAIRYELFDLPNLAELNSSNTAPLASALVKEGIIHVAIFRRPIEVRASSNRARKSLIRFAITQTLSELLNVDIDLFNEN